jgi:diphthamide biosynthesis protein 7
MGVCCIQTSPHEENVLVTGSYDEHIRVWDMRSLGKPLVDRSLGLGGGVWKLKWSPFDKRFIAAACMHNGFYIVKLEGCDIDTVAEYKNHGSLAYGIDWCKAPDRRKWCREAEDSLDDPCSPKESLLASCSFYDRSLHLWQCYL